MSDIHESYALAIYPQTFRGIGILTLASCCLSQGVLSVPERIKRSGRLFEILQSPCQIENLARIRHILAGSIELGITWEDPTQFHLLPLSNFPVVVHRLDFIERIKSDRQQVFILDQKFVDDSTARALAISEYNLWEN